MVFNICQRIKSEVTSWAGPRLKEAINWFHIRNIIEYTSDRIENEMKILLSLLDKNMFQMRFGNYKEPGDHYL